MRGVNSGPVRGKIAIAQTLSLWERAFYLSMYTTAESVTSGHPDKVCDQISDAILDACLAQDPLSRVAVETFGSHGNLVLGGEVTTRANINAIEIAREVYKTIGYTDELAYQNLIAAQSPEIACGVDTGGAGDQGIMYGYATNETQEFLPRAVVLAHALARRLETVRRGEGADMLGPDGKTQVTLRDGHVETVLVSTQHVSAVSHDALSAFVREHVIAPVIGAGEYTRLVNPTGAFTIGGFAADAGLTGRKISVDTYGGLIPHGGGAFSGKDPSKVDRSGAYMARFVAKQLVARGLAQSCTVSVAYAIGKVEPLMVEAVDERGTSLRHALGEFDFRPAAIIERFGLRRPIYRQTAAYGHFGRPDVPWEELV